MVNFAVNIDRFIKKTGLRADAVVRKVGLDMYYGVLVRSPVLTGRFRASNRISLNSRDDTTAPSSEALSSKKKGDPPDGGEQTGAMSRVLKTKFGDTIHISNNLPYALPLEMGWSKQAPGPGGIYRLTFDEVVRDFERSVNSLRFL